MMRRLITYFGLDGLPHELNTGRCECLPISSERDAYGCLIEVTLCSYTAPDGKKLRVRHTYWEAPPHEVALHSDTGIEPVNEEAEEITEEEYDRIRPELEESSPQGPPEAVHPNDPRDAWMTERRRAGVGPQDILVELKKLTSKDGEHPEWEPITTRQGVDKAINKYAERKRITITPLREKPPRVVNDDHVDSELTAIDKS
jgi:hypothetical protein